MVKKYKLPLPLPPGRWRVIWFGNLAQLPQAASALGIHTYFVLSGVANEERRIEHALVSLAHMPLLHMGAELDSVDGEISAAQPSSKLSKRSLTLDLSLSNTELITRSSLESRTLTASLANTPEYDSHLIKVKATPSSPEVFIPCSTLFLFFWAVSSSLLDAVTTEKLMRPERYLYNPKNTDLGSNPVRLEIRRQWSDDEGPYLLTLLREPGALKTGERIFKRIAGARMIDPTGPFPLEVWPPFARSLSVTGLFAQLENGLLLTHIISADLAADWTALELHREGGRHLYTSPPFVEDPERTPEPPREPPPPKGACIGPAPNNNVVQEAPSGYGGAVADLPAIAALKERFPDLSRATVERPFEKDPVERKPRKPRKITRGPWSGIAGRQIPGKRTIKGKLVGEKAREPITESAQEVSEVNTPIDEQLARFADRLTHPVEKLVIDGTELSVQWDFWNPYIGLGGACATTFFQLPRTIDDEVLTWLYRDPNCQQTKRGLCVRVTAQDSSGNRQTRYIIDLERRIPSPREGTQNAGPIKSGLMVVWFDEEASALDTCINLVIVLADAARARSPALRRRPFEGVHVATIRHGNTASQILSSAFLVPDQCDRVKRKRRVMPS